LKSRVCEICGKLIRVNQGVGVYNWMKKEKLDQIRTIIDLPNFGGGGPHPCHMQ
jgi:hypothetical protein